MVMTIDIPDRVVKHAAHLGVPVNDLVSQAIEQIGDEPLPAGFVRLGPAKHSPEEATAIIRDIASRHTLDGLSIKELIDEGRRI